MFDRSTDIPALRQEIINDPLGMGYNIKRPTLVLELLNTPDANKGGETEAEKLTVRLLLENLDPAEYAGLAEGERDYLRLFLGKSGNTDLDPIKFALASLFAPSGATRQNIGQLVRRVSRAEVLFGRGAEIRIDDLIAARDAGA